MPKKLVISYSDTEREIALKIRKELVAAGHDVWIDREGIRGDVHWTQSILDAINGCEGLVLVWSEDAKKSDDVREEIRLARVFRKTIFPVLARPGSRIPLLPEEIGTLQVIGSGEFRANITDLKARLDNPTKSNIQYPELVKKAFIPKAHNPYFVGRVRELKALFVDTRGYRGKTKAGIPVAISGLPGIGKTQLALAFGYRFNLFFPDGVYWVEAQNGIVPEFVRLGHKMRVKTLRDEHPRDYAGRVREKLCQLPNGLIIFDNVIDLKEFREWYPQGAQSCSVILTSRMPPRGLPVKTMNLSELDSESAHEMLVARRLDKEEILANPVQQDALTEICRIIGNHPLALDLCASRLQAEYLMPSDYLQFIQPDPLGRLDDENMDDTLSEAGTANLWKIFRSSYASLDEKLVDPYFLLMCCFAPQVVNQKLIMRAYGKPEEGLKALDQLANVSFTRREPSNTLSLHPLVAQFARSLLKDKDVDYPGKFVEVMLGFLRENQDNLTSDVVRMEKLHIDEALRVAEARSLWDACSNLYEYKADVEDGLQEQIKSLENAYQIIEKYLPEQKRRLPGLRLRLGKAHRAAGRVREALDDFNWAENLYRGIKDVDPAEAASLRFELGDAYLALGRYMEAEKILSEALKKAKPHLDHTAPEILQLRQALARHALDLGNFDKAGAELARVLEDRKNFYAAHPDAASASGLASVHMDMSRLELARAHYPEAMQAANAALAITKESKDNEVDDSQVYLLLGDIQYESGAYDQAEEQLEKARQIFRVTFGERHPNYGRALKALGEVHRKQGKFEEAEEEVERAITIFINVYGDAHPSVAEALAVQAKIYDHLCEFDKEQAVWEQVLDIQGRFYMEQHPALAATHYDYASLFLRKGEYDRAVDHLTRSLAITENSLGKEHAEYFGRLVRLATCLYDQQQYARAEKELDKADKLKNVIFKGSAHPYIARMFQLQSEILRRRGRFKDALRIINQAIAMKETIYGKHHPSVAEALEVKVKILHHLGENIDYLGEKIDAKLLIERTLGIRRKAYGENHPDVSRSIHDLGSYYLRLGQYKEAIEQFEQARQITATVFGRKHPDYVERTLNLANARNEQGEYRQALELLEELKDVDPARNRLLAARRLQLMGELQRRIGQFGTAMENIDRAITMKEEIYGKNHPSVAEALAVQAKIYDHLCEFDREEDIWKQVLDIQTQFYSGQHPALAATHYDYASLFLRKGEYAQAADHLTKSLAITKHSLGVNHAEYFGRLVRLATCLYDQQQYARAQETLDEADKLKNVIFKGSAHPYIARLLQLQSEVLQDLAKYDEALVVINQAIVMKEAIYGTEEHPSVAEALEAKVDLLLSQFDLDESFPILDTIERIRRKAYGTGHPQYANYQMRRARWYEIKGRYEDASDILEQSLQTCLTVFSAEHPETLKRQIMLARIARMTNNIFLAESRINRVGDTLGSRLGTEDSQIVAETYQERSNILRVQGDYQHALAELDHALKIATRIFGPESPKVIELQNEKVKPLILFHRLSEADDIIRSALQNVEHDQPIFKRLKSNLLEQQGILLVYKKEFDQAIENVEEAIKLKKHLLGDEHVELARLYVEKAVVLRHQCKYDEALADLEAARNIDNLHFNENHVYFARILLEEGRTYMDKRNLLAAQEYLNEALQIYALQPNGTIKQHADAAEALGRVYLESGRPRDALAKFEEAMDIRTELYGTSHPEMAETLYFQARAILRMSEAAEKEELKTQARQKLKQARTMLQQHDNDQAELRSEIDRILLNL